MKNRKLKILLIAYQFPPYHNVGSLRIGKFAKYLESNGHEVTVLCADKIMMPETLEVEIDPKNIVRTQWFNMNFLPQLFFGGREQVITEGYQTKSSLLKKLGYVYRLLTNFPDERAGWLPFALRAGNKILAQEKFDLIYASSPTPISLIVADRLSRKWNVPWVAEYRDPWADKVHYDFPEWRRKIEKRIEKSVLRNVSGIVTISDPLAEEYRTIFKKPVITSMNGFSMEDVNKITRTPDQSIYLQIVYTGTVHLDIVHLEPFFQAISMLRPNGEKIYLNIFTRYIEGVLEIAKKFKLENQVLYKERVPYQISLSIQRNADILLFLIPHQFGALSTKIFEYIASHRPVLAVGDTSSTAGKFIKGLDIGLVSEDPEEISNQLKIWLDMKKNKRGIPDNPIFKREGFSRDKQFEKIEDFLISLIARGKR